MYVKTHGREVLQYPYSTGQLRRDNPQTSFPEQMRDVNLAEWSVYPVVMIEPPEYEKRLQKVIQNTVPVLIEGIWCLGWDVVNKTQEEIRQFDIESATLVRAIRDRKLAETDWVVVKASELGIPVSSDWAAYRQALRDITDQVGFPHTVEWPTKP